MSTEQKPILSSAHTKPSIIPTLLDYGFLILLAVVVAAFTVNYLTQERTQIVDKPAPHLQEIFKQ